jgi:D-glycero-D-manno-heptose 1,7-bisphosphate phosphatase
MSHFSDQPSFDSPYRFLDRDGVINMDSPDYIKSWAEFRFIPGSLDAIARLTAAAVRSSSSPTSRSSTAKWLPRRTLETMHRRLRQAVSDSGGRITDIFFAPTGPTKTAAAASPKPG